MNIRQRNLRVQEFVIIFKITVIRCEKIPC
jgi:hypothetical protein